MARSSGQRGRILAWALPLGIAVMVAIFFVLLAGNAGFWSPQMRRDHPALVPLLALGLILLAPVSVLLYHWIATDPADRKGPHP